MYLVIQKLSMFSGKYSDCFAMEFKIGFMGVNAILCFTPSPCCELSRSGQVSSLIVPAWEKG